MSGYTSKVNSDIERWTASGLIGRETAERLKADIQSRAGRGFSFGSVLAIMAAMLVGVAILLFVAANWQEMPRLARIALLFSIILASYVGGAILKTRGNAGFGEALYVVGIAAFGASIALIGQMYHLSGDERDAVLLWCLGAVLAAGILRSPALTCASVALAVTWLLLGNELFYSAAPDPRFLALGLLIWLLSYWTGSVASRHVLLLSLILFGLLLGTRGLFVDRGEQLVAVGIPMALISAMIFVVAHFAHDAVERVARLGGPAPIYPFIGFLTGMGMIQMEVGDRFGPMLLASVVAFAGVIAALLLRGRESWLMRWVAYVAFTIELIILYAVTLGGMMTTSALFLFFGLVLAGAAWLIIRFEKRVAKTEGVPA